MSATEIPVSTIFFQALNLSFVGGIIYYLAKGRLNPFFKRKVDDFEKEVRVARESFDKALQEKDMWVAKLKALKEEYKSRIDSAQSDACKKAELMIEKSKEDFVLTEKNAQQDFERALRRVKNDIYQDVVENLCVLVKKSLSASTEHKRSSDFINNIKNAGGAS